MYDGAKGDAVMELGLVDNRDMFGESISNTTYVLSAHSSVSFNRLVQMYIGPITPRKRKNVTLTCTIRPT